MNPVRIGIIGVGNMGRNHLATLQSLEEARVSALGDVRSTRLDPWRDEYRTFADSQSLLESGEVDAVIIATPHYEHPRIASAALARGLHVISEKPLAVDIAEARRVEELHRTRYAHLKFAVMFQVRTSPVYRRMKQLIADGELGQISRLTWIATDWFRTWSYYASGGWRATWKGEGGGLLLNQCPHHLDLIQWLMDGELPHRVTAIASIGKTHPIEVEDEISAVLEYESGVIGHYIATTGEAPGTNRLEIAGDRGLLICQDGQLRFRRTHSSVRELRETSPDMFPRIECSDQEVELPSDPQGTGVILRNFIAAIRTGEPLIAPAAEGVKALELGNAMMMAGLTRQPVDLPLDGAAFKAFHADMNRKYAGRKTLETRRASGDLSASFTR